MNKYLLQLKEELGIYGSWALWNKNGEITEISERENFESLIKPNIIFLGLNASVKLPDNWINYHSECQKFKKKVWNQEFVKKLADLIMSDELSILQGSYMTDIIKDIDFQESSMVMGEIKRNPEILRQSKEIFEKELNLLSKIFLTNNFQIICIGKDAFNILCRIWNIPTKKRTPTMRFAITKRCDNLFEILEIPHYSYRKKESIKQDLIEMIEKL